MTVKRASRTVRETRHLRDQKKRSSGGGKGGPGGRPRFLTACGKIRTRKCVESILQFGARSREGGKPGGGEGRGKKSLPDKKKSLSMEVQTARRKEKKSIHVWK